FAGKISVDQKVTRITLDGEHFPETIRYLYAQKGLEREEILETAAGDIVAVAGLEGIEIGETLADVENPIALPAIKVEEPTVRMVFGVNSAPFSGRESRWGTSRKLRERLFNELKSNVALRVEETDGADTFIVSGRGELHLAILIETMRREGYEFQVSRPEVILREGPDGKMEEPYEEVHIETSPDTVGAVVEMLGKRRGEMVNMLDSASGSVLLTFIVPTRGMLGFRYQFLTATRGLGVMNTLFHGYMPASGAISSRNKGSLVAWEAGITTTFGLKNAEERGTLFVAPGIEVYAGMVVGEHQRPGDLEVNVCKAKHLTNMRNSIRDIEVRLTPPREMSLDECIEYLADDELLEVTPQSLRIRKRTLDHNIRNREIKRAKAEVSFSVPNH
ncbi:MAG: translational GTPase TypA, partial [Anaerolineales bacterium]